MTLSEAVTKCILSSVKDYRGGYSDDKRSGHGTYTWPSGATFTGRFAENTREGYGTYISSTGEKYEVSKNLFSWISV